MTSDNEVLCDLCAEPVRPNDGTTVHVEQYGQTFAFTYHNTAEKPCLRAYLYGLQKIFEMKSN